MQKFTPFRSALLGCAAVAILGACSGADGVASPGVGAFVPAPSTPAPPTSPGPTPPTTPPGTPAADCPAGFANVGIVASKRICQLPSLITGNLVIAERAGTVYSVSGQTRVGTDAGPSAASPLPGSQTGILTIEPGVTIFGNSGSDYLLVNRGSQIFAEGTATNPIILTSRQSVEGTTGPNSIGQWGGLIILGRAPSSDGCPGGVTPPSASCEAQVEGGNQFYGGTLAGDNSGRVRYLRVMHSGFEIAPGNELNGITLAGVGNGTVVEYVQVHNSSDDGIEIFGGTVNLRYIVLTGNDDDGFDTDSGWSGAAQFGIAYQRTGGGDFGFETSSRGASSASYHTRPTYANWTIVQRSESNAAQQRRAGIIHNSGHIGRTFNSVITAQNGVACLTLADAQTLSNSNGLGSTGPAFNSVFFSCGASPFQASGTVTAAQIEALVDAGANNVKNGTSTLINGFINGANENAVTPTAYPAGLNTNYNGVPVNSIEATTSFLETRPYIGAVQNASDTWYAGWSCGLPTQPGC
ncbi:hypothetical protein [Hyphomonas sp.]|uniref:hypothetical protein n=1 Tax=Hyphomonas sp. TaxID=87 RepID=UPI00391D5199